MQQPARQRLQALLARVEVCGAQGTCKLAVASTQGVWLGSLLLLLLLLLLCCGAVLVLRLLLVTLVFVLLSLAILKGWHCWQLLKEGSGLLELAFLVAFACIWAWLRHFCDC